MSDITIILLAFTPLFMYFIVQILIDPKMLNAKNKNTSNKKYKKEFNYES